jgi:hypothetical protein
MHVLHEKKQYNKNYIKIGILMHTWILASITTFILGLLAHFIGANPWTAYDIFTATCLFAICLKTKD